MPGALSAFLQNHLVTIYFFYGLALFAMGLALWLESRRASQLDLAQAVQLLALFGLLHSIHEFAEMFDLIAHKPPPLWIGAARGILLAISFLPLLAFGIKLLPHDSRPAGFTARMTILAAVAYGMQIIIIWITYAPSFEEWVHAIYAIARYTLGIPGATLAALALVRQQRALRERDMASFARDLGTAALALIWYGSIGQAFASPSIIFPSMLVNTLTFEHWFGFPVQLLRGAMAVVVAVAMIRALRAFEEENRRRLVHAQAAERELKLAARELLLLYEASQLTTASQDLDRLLQDAIERIVQIIDPVKGGAICVLEPKQPNMLRRIASYGSVTSLRDCFEPTNKEAIRNLTLEPYWQDRYGRDVSSQITATPLPDKQSESIPIQRVRLPLETRQQMVGAVMLETAPEGPYLLSLEAPTIVALARQLAIAIENAWLVLQLKERDARRSELLQRATNAQEAERKRIARELHDETGQALTALALGLSGMRRLMEKAPEKAVEQFSQLQSISTTALDELRHLIADLRPSHLDVLGLVAALRWYSEQVTQRYALPIEFQITGEIMRLSPELETTLFRIAQEGLSNIVKHAGAKHAWLLLTFAPESVQMNLRDDGEGFDLARVLQPGAGRAWGLIGIQERVALAGGDMTIETNPGEGAVLTVRVPSMSIIDHTLERQESHATY